MVRSANSGENVAARLSPPDSISTRSRFGNFARMRAAAGLDAGDAIRRQRARAYQELGIPFGVDVVGDRGDVVTLAHRLAEQVHQRSLARSDRTADADPKGTVGFARHVASAVVPAK